MIFFVLKRMSCLKCQDLVYDNTKRAIKSILNRQIQWKKWKYNQVSCQTNCFLSLRTLLGKPCFTLQISETSNQDKNKNEDKKAKEMQQKRENGWQLTCPGIFRTRILDSFPVSSLLSRLFWKKSIDHQFNFLTFENELISKWWCLISEYWSVWHSYRWCIFFNVPSKTILKQGSPSRLVQLQRERESWEYLQRQRKELKCQERCFWWRTIQTFLKTNHGKDQRQTLQNSLTMVGISAMVVVSSLVVLASNLLPLWSESKSLLFRWDLWSERGQPGFHNHWLLYDFNWRQFKQLLQTWSSSCWFTH